jgi:hypothetical protein
MQPVSCAAQEKAIFEIAVFPRPRKGNRLFGGTAVRFDFYVVVHLIGIVAVAV